MDLITRMEEILLLAVWRLGDEAYGVAIRKMVEEMTGKSFSVGAIYIPLERLKSQGYLSDRFGDPTPERGGRRKRFYKVTQAGLEALREARRLQDAIWAQAPDHILQTMKA